MKRPQHLTPRELAVVYRRLAQLGASVEKNAEHIELVGPFAKRYEPKHACADRFATWRIQIRLAVLSRLYSSVPLLGGLRP
jgi:hypothetical protein